MSIGTIFVKPLSPQNIRSLFTTRHIYAVKNKSDFSHLWNHLCILYVALNITRDRFRAFFLRKFIKEIIVLACEKKENTFIHCYQIKVLLLLTIITYSTNMQI